MVILLWIPVLVILILFAAGIRIVRPIDRGLIERLGKYHRFAEPGFNWIIPIIDSIIKVNITEMMVDAEKQEIITDDNLNEIEDIIEYADSLGVSDIRIIPAAQTGTQMKGSIIISKEILDRHPILRYRIKNYKKDIPFRGLRETDSHHCALVLDDMAASHGKHYPCIIYMREYGKNIGHINKHMRADRLLWYQSVDTHTDPICKISCLDVCREYNNRYEYFHREA